MLGLFSGFGHRLRAFRVRPLIFEGTNPPSRNFDVNPYLNIAHIVSRIALRHVAGFAAKIIRNANRIQKDASPQVFHHIFHHGPARARRQALFVLDRPWEAPKPTCS